jgi:hypothetical protein
MLTVLRSRDNEIGTAARVRTARWSKMRGKSRYRPYGFQVFKFPIRRLLRHLAAKSPVYLTRLGPSRCLIHGCV